MIILKVAGNCIYFLAKMGVYCKQNMTKLVLTKLHVVNRKLEIGFCYGITSVNKSRRHLEPNRNGN